MKQGSQYGSYIIQQKLGEGGFSEVYAAYNRQRHEIVALKLLDPSVTTTEEGRQRFQREVEAARRLRYRHIVPVYEAGIHNGRAFLAMRLMHGGTLDARLKRSWPLSSTATAQIIRHTARALDYGRRLGIIHRDVKPSNIFYQSDSVVCLGDFGLAKVRGLITITRHGQVIGTLYYMAPEQVRGLAYSTERSDVYALGVVLYEMLAGRVPFQGHSQASILHAIAHTPPPRPRQFNSDISPEVERVVLRALNKDPIRRYASARELAAAYQKALGQGGHRFVIPPRSAQRNHPARQPALNRPQPAKLLLKRGPHRFPGKQPALNRPTTERAEFWVTLLALAAVLLFLLYIAD